MSGDNKDTPAITAVKAETWNQLALWGVQNHPDGTRCSRFGLDALKAAREVYEYKRAHGVVTWASVLEEEFWEVMTEEDPEDLRAELVQLAAVCVSWIEAIDRRQRQE